MGRKILRMFASGSIYEWQRHAESPADLLNRALGSEILGTVS